MAEAIVTEEVFGDKLDDVKGILGAVGNSIMAQTGMLSKMTSNSNLQVKLAKEAKEDTERQEGFDDASNNDVDAKFKEPIELPSLDGIGDSFKESMLGGFTDDIKSTLFKSLATLVAAPFAIAALSGILEGVFDFDFDPTFKKMDQGATSMVAAVSEWTKGNKTFADVLVNMAKIAGISDEDTSTREIITSATTDAASAGATFMAVLSTMKKFGFSKEALMATGRSASRLPGTFVGGVLGGQLGEMLSEVFDLSQTHAALLTATTSITGAIGGNKVTLDSIKKLSTLAPKTGIAAKVAAIGSKAALPLTAAQMILSPSAIQSDDSELIRANIFDKINNDDSITKPDMIRSIETLPDHLKEQAINDINEAFMLKAEKAFKQMVVDDNQYEDSRKKFDGNPLIIPGVDVDVSGAIVRDKISSAVPMSKRPLPSIKAPITEEEANKIYEKMEKYNKENAPIVISNSFNNDITPVNNSKVNNISNGGGGNTPTPKSYGFFSNNLFGTSG